MSKSAESLKMAVEYEKKAVEQYREAVKHSGQKESQEAISKIIQEMDQHIDTIHWIIMAESGRLEGSTESAPQQETGATKLAAGKCPFSGELAKMGIDISNFDMSKFKP